MNDSGSRAIQVQVAREALDGRLPILSSERIYRRFGSFLWTPTSFSAATWAFLIGGSLPSVGNTVIGILGYLCGLILALVSVVLASGLPSYRYGIDPIDAAKASFGVNGTVLPLLGALATMIGWTYVALALTARGATGLLQVVQHARQPNEDFSTAVALGTLVIVWIVACRGPNLFQRLSQYTAPGQLIVTLTLLGLLVYRFHWNVLWTSNIAPEAALTQDHGLRFAYAVEFGVASGITWWPIMGGLTRLVEKRRHLLGPCVIGSGILGAAFISAVSAIGAARVGSPDPTVWLLALGGPLLGSALLSFVLAANVITMVILIYLAGVTVQQLRPLTRIPWGVLLALLLAPGIYVAFRTTWVLEVVMTWMLYNGVMFVGITGITLVDYLVLRRQRLSMANVFTRSSAGQYWYWAGVNWVAIGVALTVMVVYILMYDPSTYRAVWVFRYLGAAIPMVLLAGGSYFLLARFVLRPMGKGGYCAPQADHPSPVSLRDVSL
jgi:NCS1 family nucleobase:cation symporter-1